MTPDFIMGDTPETTGIPDTGPERTDDPDVGTASVDAATGHRVKVYDGLVLDLEGNPGTIGADANGD